MPYPASGIARWTVVRFIVTLGLFIAVIEVTLCTNFFLERVVGPELDACAAILAFTLRLLGEPATSSGPFVEARYVIEIVQGCDALRPVLLFVAAVAASPVRWWTKIPGILAGSAILIVANLIRLVILYYVGVHYSQEVFDFLHRNVSQVGFILLVVFLWILWALWAVKKNPSAAGIASPGAAAPAERDAQAV